MKNPTNKTKVNNNLKEAMEMKAAIEKIVNNEMSKSNKMKELYKLNLTIKEIAALMNTRYNFVYNVISNMCNVTGQTIVTSKNNEPSKKNVIIDMYVQKYSMKEISVTLKTNYNYVFNVIKQFKAANEVKVD